MTQGKPCIILDMAISVERSSPQRVEPDVPVGLIIIDETPSYMKPKVLEEKANAYLEEPEKRRILDLAKQKGRDIVAVVTARGTGLYIGAGIAATLTTAAIGAVIIYEHKKHK